ncbi:hypothetical protein FY528_07580 [Hymenobacter lutimineralis]|uniref:STAS/SEC14 domain-containing protein n=1 Tax=Hymenobacter lutimineralis TaxID=2606448 RepID=A0A5D6V6G6_9BACT|nr:hypothetical protein [Hymenobacter lutimineralis]TYZ10910.1 hypothetical protein FY528_07580 [Hymenobacter lutimineralis]
MPPITSPAYFAITYHARRRVLVGQWQRSIMPFELNQGYHRLLEVAEAYECRFWLVDTVRWQAPADAATVLWMIETFLPKLYPRLGDTVYLAFLMAPHQLAGVLTNHAIPPLAAINGTPYQLQRFTDEATALRWLRRCRTGR